MTAKARFVSYINVLILILLLLFYWYGTGIIVSVMGPAILLPFLLILLLVFIVWGVINAFKYFSNKTMSSVEYLLLSVPLINLILIFAGALAIASMTE